MIIKSIRLKNIRSYLDAKIDFPTGSTLLAGDVGSGKSTILLAVDFALFGLRRGEVEGSDLLRHGKNTGEVETVFEVRGIEIMVRRVLKRTKTGVSQDTGAMRINGTLYDYTPTEIKARILELLGYPGDAVKKNRPIFRYTVYTPQEDMKRIMLDPLSRIETLRKIFGVDRYGIIRVNSKTFATELRSMARESRALSADIDKKKNEIAEAEERTVQAEKKISDLSLRLSAIKKNISQKQEEYGAIKDRAKERNELQKTIAEKRARVSSGGSRMSDIESEIAGFTNRTKEYKEKINALPSQPLHEVREEIEALSARRDALSRDTALLEDATKNLAQLIKDGRCSMCGQDVGGEGFSAHMKEKTKLLANARKDFLKTDNKLAGLRSVMSDLEKAEHLQKTLADAEKYLDAKLAEKKRLAGHTATLEEEISKLEARLDSTSDIDKISGVLEAEIAALGESRLETERERAALSAQKEAAQKTSSVLKKELEEKKKHAEKAKRYESLDSWLSSFSSLMETMERHVMVSLQQEFNSLFQQWFSLLMGDSLYVRIDDSFSPVVEQNGFETRYENLSGGEKTAVALAYRLALNKVINEMIDTINTKDLLILDEPTDGFSTDQLDHIRDVINQMNLRQIILVSHEPKIDTYVNNVIRVYKENHSSKTIS